MSTLRFFMRIGRNTSHYGQHQRQLSLCLNRAAVAATTALNNSNGHEDSRRCYTSYSVSCKHFSHIKKWCTPTMLSTAPQTLPLFPWRGDQFATHNFGHSCKFNTKSAPDRAGKSDTKASPALADDAIFGESSNLGLFAKFKLMYKKYWYVLIPVHVVTSLGWFGGFYYMSKSGVDVAALMQYMHMSESIIEKVQHSKMGHIAIAYLCYKVATPLRYAVTLGGTTISIKYLVQSGHIKPIPSKQEFIQMYEQKKANMAAAKAEKEEKAAEELEKNMRDKENK